MEAFDVDVRESVKHVMRAELVASRKAEARTWMRHPWRDLEIGQSITTAVDPYNIRRALHSCCWDMGRLWRYRVEPCAAPADAKHKRPWFRITRTG